MKERPILFRAPMVRAILDGSVVIPRKVYAKGGEPADSPYLIALRLLAGIESISEEGCWLWGKAVSAGYGCMTVCGRTVRTHVLAYTVGRGEIPDQMHVCHGCDNPLCINPDHLFLGTHSDNMQDMVKKGRHGGPPLPRFGSDNHATKLTGAQVAEIKGWLECGNTQAVTARYFDVSQATISKIARGLR